MVWNVYLHRDRTSVAIERGMEQLKKNVFLSGLAYLKFESSALPAPRPQNVLVKSSLRSVSSSFRRCSAKRSHLRRGALNLPAKAVQNLIKNHLIRLLLIR